MEVDLMPQFHLRLREDVYTYILRTIDLNFGYTDYLDNFFKFAIEEEYFKSEDYLLKTRTIINTNYLSMSLFTKEGELLTELGMKKPVICIDYHLNRRHNYDIQMEDMSAYFIQEGIYD
jgi:hypothetical protein